MADGELLLDETFDPPMLAAERWIPIIYGDSRLNEHLERLRHLDQERLRQMGPSDTGGEPESVAELGTNLGTAPAFTFATGETGPTFDLTRWETWRRSVTRQASLYKSLLLENARRNMATNPAGAQVLRELQHEVVWTMAYGPEEIANMIPETTPTGTGMTPSPVSNVGFPHGDWRWSHLTPDVIIDGPTGMVFPNDQYPEDIVLVANYGGKEQRFTFHRSKDWRFAGFPLGFLLHWTDPHRKSRSHGQPS